jgi:hypothetical protein
MRQMGARLKNRILIQNLLLANLKLIIIVGPESIQLSPQLMQVNQTSSADTVSSLSFKHKLHATIA